MMTLADEDPDTTKTWADVFQNLDQWDAVDTCMNRIDLLTVQVAKA